MVESRCETRERERDRQTQTSRVPRLRYHLVVGVSEKLVSSRACMRDGGVSANAKVPLSETRNCYRLDRVLAARAATVFGGGVMPK